MANEPQNLPNRHNALKIEFCSALSLSKGLPCVAFCEAGTSTSVEDPLQITYFLCKTNPILSAVGGLQMNVNTYNIKDYERKRDWTLGQNKPNSNPIKPNFRKAKMNANAFSTMNYKDFIPLAGQKNKPNSNPMGFQIPSINSKDRLVICNGKYSLDIPAFAGEQTDVIIVPENGQYSFTAFFT